MRRQAIGTVVTSAISTPTGRGAIGATRTWIERRDRERGGDQGVVAARCGAWRDGNRSGGRRKSASGLSRDPPAGRWRGLRGRRACRPCPLPAPHSSSCSLLNAVGYVVALATGLVDPLPGLVNGSKTNAPLVIWGAQTIGVACSSAAAAPAASSPSSRAPSRSPRRLRRRPRRRRPRRRPGRRPGRHRRRHAGLLWASTAAALVATAPVRASSAG